MKKIVLYVLIVFPIFFSSCSKEKEQLLSNESKPNYPRIIENPIEGISCENGILIFPSWEIYYQIDSIISDYSFEERVEWENSLNFKSQKTIFDDIASKEYDTFITPYVDKTESFFIENAAPDHCIEYYKGLNDGIIEVLYDEGTFINYTVKELSVVGVINEDGFVIIDSILYQYIGDVKKYMINGTVGDCEILNSASITNEIIKIFIEPIPKIGAGEGQFYKSRISGSAWVYSGSCRASSTVSMKIEGYGNPNTEEYTMQLKCYPLVITVNSQQKNGWGNWNQYHGEYNISGFTQVKVDEGYSSGPTNPNYEGQFLLNFTSINSSTSAFPVTKNINMVHFNGIIWPSVISKYFWCYSNINPLHCNIRADIAGGASGIVINTSF